MKARNCFLYALSTTQCYLRTNKHRDKSSLVSFLHKNINNNDNKFKSHTNSWFCASLSFITMRIPDWLTANRFQGLPYFPKFGGRFYRGTCQMMQLWRMAAIRRFCLTQLHKTSCAKMTFPLRLALIRRFCLTQQHKTSCAKMTFNLRLPPFVSPANCFSSTVAGEQCSVNTVTAQQCSSCSC